MKLKLIILLLLSPFFLLGQNTTFESVFQTLKNTTGNTNEVCHFTLKVSIKPNLIEITQDSKLVFNFPVNFETVDRNIYAYSEGEATVVFNANEQKLTVVNSKVLWVIYGKIPVILKVD